MKRPHLDASPVQALVGALNAVFEKGGSLTATGLTEAVDAPARALTRRAAEQAVAAPRSLSDEQALARLLAERPGSSPIGSASASAVATEVAERFGPLRFLARRSSMWVVAAFGPALYASVTRGADEIGMLAVHLVHRTRAAGLEPDPELVRRAAVQLATGVTVDTSIEARHGPLVLSWASRAVKAALPFGGGVATRDPASLASAAARVPPVALARPHEVG